MPDTPTRGFADRVIFGAIAAIMSALLLVLIGILSFLFNQVMTTNAKIVELETTVRGVTQERSYQIQELRDRLNRLETRRERRDRP